MQSGRDYSIAFIWFVLVALSSCLMHKCTFGSLLSRNLTPVINNSSTNATNESLSHMDDTMHSEYPM